MKTIEKIISIALTLCMIVSVAAVGIVPAAADTTYETYAQDTIQGSAILHCFNWSYNNIKAALPDIAKAGYTAVQTSPVQAPKNYSASWTDLSGQWWKMYQPLGLTIASSGTSWLGSATELTSLCTEAEKYNIKVVVDIVANHLANNGTDGGTYSYLNSDVESDMKNSAYYHTNNTSVNDDSRYNITQYHLGMPDLNTGNSYVQTKALNLLKACIDCGVDGFRFDAAKHIELPTDDSSFRSNFWPTVINGAKSYASTKGVAEPFFYGEILGGAGTDISNYTTYMAVTDNYTGDHALDKTYWKYAPELADSTYYKGASAAKSVLWVESHDTYMGSSGSAWTGNTADVSDDVITRAWAFVASRNDSTSLFFARPNNTMGYASTDTTWKSTEVAEVNKFKNAFNGQSEYIAYEYNSSTGVNVAYNERGTKGVVISKLDGGGSVSLTAHNMAAGTYLDHVSGNTFTVANGKITGTVGTKGVAVVYNTSDTGNDDGGDDDVTIDTLYLVPNSNWKADGARFAAYFFGGSSTTWRDMTSVSDSMYSVSIPSGDYTKVIFCRMNGSTSENNWDNKWDQTQDLTIPTSSNRYTIKSGVWTEESSSDAGTWDYYETTCTHSYGEPTWTWSNNNGSAYATFTCTICGEQVSKTATVTQVDNGNNTVTYTATVTGPDDQTYTKSITETKPAEFSGTLYLKPGTNWSKSSARFAIYFFNNTNGKTWVSMTDTDGDGIYEATVPAGTWQEAIFCRMSGSSSTNDWDYRLDQTDDLTPESGKNCYNISNSATIGDGSDTKDAGQWSALYTVTWKDDNGQVLKTELVTKGSTPSYSGTTPTKASTAQYDYTFSGWTPMPSALSADTEYTAVYTEQLRSYTITWIGDNDTVLDTDTVAYGTTPVYSGTAPTKAGDAQYAYTFTGWSPEVVAVTGDATYTARFDPIENTYTVTWKNDDGTVLETDTAVYGSTPSYGGVTPVKEVDAQYSYTFDGWSPEVVAVTGDATYTAVYQSTAHIYDVPRFEWTAGHTSCNAYFDCTVCGYTDVMYTSSIGTNVTPATCTEPEFTDYSAAFVHGEDYYFASDSVQTGESLGHNLAHTDALAPTMDADGNIEYWYCETCGKYFADEQAQTEITQDDTVITHQRVVGYTISLKDEIGVNFYVAIPDYFDRENAVVTFTWGTGAYQKTVQTKLAPPSTRAASANYMATCYVAARSMTDTVAMTITDQNGDVILTGSYRVVDYAGRAATEYANNANLKKLLCDMLDYGAAAQVQFGYKATGDDADLANAYISKVDSSWARTDAADSLTDDTNLKNLNDVSDTYGIKFSGATLSTDSKTVIRLYFTVTDAAAFAATQAAYGDAALTFEDNANQTMKYIELNDVVAKNTFSANTIKFTNGDNSIELKYNAANYYNAVVGGNYQQSLKDVMKAMYNYSLSANNVL